jgi:hypothetical protein
MQAPEGRGRHEGAYEEEEQEAGRPVLGIHH